MKSLLIFPFVCFGLAIFLAGVLVGENFDLNNKLKLTKSEPLLGCGNISLIETADCLHEELKTFYNYNLSNIGKKLSLEQLKKEGGVCSHYSEWYTKRAKELGFDTKEVIIEMGDYLHEFAVISSEEFYCIMDQTFNPSCYHLSVETKEDMKNVNKTE